METEMELVLYTRPGCHLCDVVAEMMRRAGITWRAVDIETDPELEKEYGMRIPVLRLPDTGRELAYPFDEDGLRAFLQEQQP
jgi:glutaredoxin